MLRAGEMCIRDRHLIELVAVFVQAVVPVGQQDAALELSLVDTAVVNCDFCRCAGVEGVEQFRVVKEHGRFVLFAGDGVVDVVIFPLAVMGIFFLPFIKNAFSGPL